MPGTIFSPRQVKTERHDLSKSIQEEGMHTQIQCHKLDNGEGGIKHPITTKGKLCLPGN